MLNEIILDVKWQTIETKLWYHTDACVWMEDIWFPIQRNVVSHYLMVDSVLREGLQHGPG